MARPRTFDEAEAVTRAARTFRARGYEATSVDDLLAATGMNRASLYSVFGSKYGLFRRGLAGALADLGGTGHAGALDLLLVALMELAPTDDAVRALIEDALAREQIDPASLGTRILRRAGIRAY